MGSQDAGARVCEPPLIKSPSKGLGIVGLSSGDFSAITNITSRRPCAIKRL